VNVQTLVVEHTASITEEIVTTAFSPDYKILLAGTCSSLLQTQQLMENATPSSQRVAFEKVNLLCS
jgi:hypothetical protein